ncbi:uncharacterized protein B0I36DRAFT_317644 [Microdochium trichocladiopsis]|uniref:Peptidase M20 dimerisation domain-containing protein n=1 Tax=Microdochium trichocladiopsis TaxID=1682393 RepID=A0A9P8YB97_9PEZI|nr:uncharacterized protein B0I36DRAFT_317644 [Microdochium trichocladiopsis]KAH7035107.1 hypothetical protein B0I36DRAFT_317644 [Microdochium trichocladiopsis]
MDSNSSAFDGRYLKPIEQSIKQHFEEIKAINDTIFRNPELAWNENIAHDVICDHFDALGSDFTVYRHAYGLKTAFVVEARHDASDHGATVSNGVVGFPVPKEPERTVSEPDFVAPPPIPKNGRLVIFNAEYDALPVTSKLPRTTRPGVSASHACGHNLITSSSVAAFTSCWEALKHKNREEAYLDHRVPRATMFVRLLGTPAEESGGGKIKLLRAGAYEGASACLMAHPGPLAWTDTSLRALALTSSLASQRLIVNFDGQASHMAFHQPTSTGTTDGAIHSNRKNALDALVIAYVSISALARELKPPARVFGFIRSGGTAANVVPDRTRAEYSIRAKTIQELVALRKEVTRRLKAGGAEAGCTTHVIDSRATYWNLISNEPLCQAFSSHMSNFGISTAYTLPEITDNPVAATDQGNVSHHCPAMQAAFFIDSRGAFNHQPEFAACAGTDDAFARAMDCAKGLAAVGVDVLTNDVLHGAVRSSFEESLRISGSEADQEADSDHEGTGMSATALGEEHSAGPRAETMTGAAEGISSTSATGGLKDMAETLETKSASFTLEGLANLSGKTREGVIASLMGVAAPPSDTLTR